MHGIASAEAAARLTDLLRLACVGPKAAAKKLNFPVSSYTGAERAQVGASCCQLVAALLSPALWYSGTHALWCWLQHCSSKPGRSSR